MFSISDHTRCRWVCFFIRKFSIVSFVRQCILCSEWVPSEWESDKNITIIHMTSADQISHVKWKVACLFYQLFGLSFWRHPFTAEGPMVNKWRNAKFLQIYSNEQKTSSTSWMAWEWVHFYFLLSFIGEILILSV